MSLCSYNVKRAKSLIREKAGAEVEGERRVWVEVKDVDEVRVTFSTTGAARQGRANNVFGGE